MLFVFYVAWDDDDKDDYDGDLDSFDEDDCFAAVGIINKLPVTGSSGSGSYRRAVP